MSIQIIWGELLHAIAIDQMKRFPCHLYISTCTMVYNYPKAAYIGHPSLTLLGMKYMFCQLLSGPNFETSSSMSNHKPYVLVK